MFNSLHKSTPVAGIKLGYARAVHPLNQEISAFEVQPAIGWSWGLNSGNGLTLMLGAKILTVPLQVSETNTMPLSVLPALSFAFEF